VTRPHFQAESYEMHRDMLRDHDSSIRHLHELCMRIAGMQGQEIETWVDKERRWLESRSVTFDKSVDGPARRGSKYVVINLNTAREYVLDRPGIDPESPREREFYVALLDGSGPFRLAATFDPVTPQWLRYPSELWINLAPSLRVYEVLPPVSASVGHTAG
jgi:hypothetical protein